ncbi:MAG: hypothetical protein GY894_05930 [Planctomycetes bacterium]|nr:hypothetical protein [Planctomycetota bacterium]MCP4838886.1 hypothetical protein [Planctomycetota bacterium]
MRIVLYLPILFCLVACAPEARWPQETSIQTASPADAPVPEAIASAVDWWMTHEPTARSNGPVEVYLAPSLAAANTRLASLLPSCTIVDTDNGIAVAVRAVRMHHSSAQIDLDTPRPERGRQLITLDMQKYVLTPWQVTGANWWRFNNNQLKRITNEAVTASLAKPAEEATSTATAESDNE